MKDIKHGIDCNVSNCVFNEHGCNCNLERINVSKGKGENHFCKSYIPLEENKKEEDSIFHDSPSSIESSPSIEEYFNL
ncbi:MAG: DUF1540 domain-containing protein [Clostridia bacterium]|nr:DUF1540 domain-containing protein [Clostridia bacterium]